MSLFDGITPDEEERYFLNLSDGEPYFVMTSPDSGMSLGYHGDTGGNHTKTQVDKIRRLGVDILSYFIEEEYEHQGNMKQPIKSKPLSDNPKRTLFRKMYGKNAKFIRVDEIMGLAKTLNELFLNKSKSR
jgi:hypothetical protein